jgi:Cu/Ag efflux protein CusF
MNKFILKAGLAGLLAVALAGTPLAVRAQTNAAAPASPKKATNRVLPFHGKLKAVDNSAKTISVGKETFQVTSATKITKLAKPATLEEGAVGDDVAGSYRKDADGKLIAVSLRFGPKPPPPEPGDTQTNKTKTP